MVHLHAHRGGPFFFQSGSCSPRAQLMRPPNSLDGSLGTLSMASNTSFRSAFGSVILPDFVGTPLIGASRLHMQAVSEMVWCYPPACTGCHKIVRRRSQTVQTPTQMQSWLTSSLSGLHQTPAPQCT